LSVRAPASRKAGWLAELGPLPFVLLPFVLLPFALLRQASADLFVQEGARWRRIAGVYAGRARASCLQRCPGNAALGSLVGATVRVEFCGEHAVAVEVAGRRYAHPALAETSVRMCG